MDDMVVNEIRARLHNLGDAHRAQFLKGFFKTGPGEYAEGDIFLGIRVPDVRKLTREYKALKAGDVVPLLRSPLHEERLFALLVFVREFSRGDGSPREEIFKLYRENLGFINNWDLVDLSAPTIVGGFLEDGNRDYLYRLAESPVLWERRIAIMATFHFIRQRRFEDTLTISKLLLNDGEDLIHKAAGWMLREVGKRDAECEEAFLKEHCREMPRTMLRYAIEKFPPSRRRMYLDGSI
jgi:3-methyladenine DNA glycosylase AlkD